MNAFTKLVNEQKETNKNKWDKVLLGQITLVITPDMYTISRHTIRAQAINEGFKTFTEGEKLIIYK